MSCQICGKATGPGALLCKACKSALKRARQFTVLELPGTPGSVTMPGLLTEARRATSPPRRSTAARWRLAAAKPVVLIASALVALGTLAFVGQRLGSGPEAEWIPVPSNRALAPAPTSLPSPPLVVANPERLSDIVPPPPPARAKTAPPKTPVKSPAADVALQMRAEAVLADAPVSGPSIAAVEAPKPAPVAAAPARPVDRWQVMSDALARCASEGGFTGFFCDQRVRLNSCEGYWGQVPQCPLPPENPR